MKRTLSLLALLLLLLPAPKAEEGMWIPMLLEQLNLKRMQDLGLELSAEDIYSVNRSSLKDAIVQFGGGCTAEIVSPEGLLLTNHHCGLGAIQRLSSLENDYIANGFWAQSYEEELPCAGLTVTMLVRMEEVTDRMMEGITPEMNQLQRQQALRQNAEKIEQQMTEGTHYEARVRSFFYGNRYYVFINEVFRDIRLVGAPPASIGKFGGDTDNWMWPRHTGDFSIFRIYVGSDNKPASYSKDNVPYKPKTHLKIFLKGYEKGDFTFVFGYPGTTREYLTSYGVDVTVNKENPLRIDLRSQRLDIINAAMNDSRLVRIQYTSKAAGIANYWKKMIGESRGIRQFDAVKKKEQFEQAFRGWAAGNPQREAAYGKLLDQFSSAYQSYLPINLSSIYLSEAGQSIELVRFAAGFRSLVQVSKKKDASREDLSKALAQVKKAATDFYRNYSPAIDRRIAASMLREMKKGMDPRWLPDVFTLISTRYGGDFDRYVSDLFENSVFADSVKLSRLLDPFKPSRASAIEKDPGYRLMTSIYEPWDKTIIPGLAVYSGIIDSLQRIYMAGQMEMQKDKVFYPDANSTLRIAYGKVDDYSPADAVRYGFFTTLAGVIQKEDTTVYDYRVDPRLKKLFAGSDYGPYADRDGTLHVAFTASNHTTGGNSGSPVLNARGELIGINFDRNWEGTLSDLMYDPSKCRNISLDIRYCLFVVDRVAGCRRLVEEMELVQR